MLRLTPVSKTLFFVCGPYFRIIQVASNHRLQIGRWKKCSSWREKLISMQILTPSLKKKKYVCPSAFLKESANQDIARK
jgi:hypothetical protein